MILAFFWRRTGDDNDDYVYNGASGDNTEGQRGNAVQDDLPDKQEVRVEAMIVPTSDPLPLLPLPPGNDPDVPPALRSPLDLPSGCVSMDPSKTSSHGLNSWPINSQILLQSQRAET
jgi:hypothetical protein